MSRRGVLVPPLEDNIFDQEKLGACIDALFGPSFLAAVRRVHQESGDVLGLTRKKTPRAEGARVAEALYATRQAIRFHVRRVIPAADEEDPTSVALVEEALAPLRTAQESARRRRATGEPDPDPADAGEIPPLPTA